MGGVSKRQQVTGLFELQSGEMPVIVQYQNGKVLHEIPEPGIKSVLFMPDNQAPIKVSDDQIKFWNVEDIHKSNRLPFTTPNPSPLLRMGA